MREADRRIIESPLYQGVDEQIAYSLDISNWGTSPSSPSVVIKDVEGTDVSGDILSGSADVSGNNVITPIVQSVVADTQYRLEIKFTTGGNILEAWADLFGQT